MATKKVKKFGRGGDILTGIGAALAGYGAYKMLTKDKDYTSQVKEYGTKGEGSSEEKAAPKKSETPVQDTDERIVPKQEEKADVRPKSDTGSITPIKKTEKYDPNAGQDRTPVKGVKPISVPTKKKVDLAKQRVGVGYEKLGMAPEKKADTAPRSVVFKNDDTDKKASPVKTATVNKVLKAPAPDLSAPKGIDLKGTNKTVYGTDTTSVFQKKAAQERKEKEEAEARKKKEAAQAKEFRERQLAPLKKGGMVKKYASGGSVKTAKPTMRSASARADGIAIRGKTRA